MGLNVNLTYMIKAPEKVKCPKCGHKIDTNFDDYDIDCGHPNPEPGEWKLHGYCHECETDYYVTATLKPKWTVT